jgi:ubiquinone/menaquinone biosynthesis C-methylase UbiE
VVVRPGSGRGSVPVISRSLAAAYSDTAGAWQAGPGRVYDRLAVAVVGCSPVPLRNELVLDIGAGTGAASRAIVAVGGRPVAADLAPAMIATLRKAIVPPPPAVVADLRALPVATGGAGAAIAAFSLNHVTDPEHAVRELARVTRPDGPIVVSAYADDDAHPVRGAVQAALTESGWEPADWYRALRRDAMPLLARPEAAVAIGRAAGLREVAARRLEVAFPELSPADLVGWRLGMAQHAPYVASLPSEVRAEVAARATQRLGPSPPVLIRRVVVLVATSP